MRRGRGLKEMNTSRKGIQGADQRRINDKGLTEIL